MASVLMQPIAPILFGAVIGLVCYLVRHHVLARPRTVNYFMIFMDAAACYVFIAMLVNHKVYGATYADMLRSGFGVDEVGIAFLFACYHFIIEILGKTCRKA